MRRQVFDRGVGNRAARRLGTLLKIQTDSDYENGFQRSLEMGSRITVENFFEVLRTRVLRR